MEEMKIRKRKWKRRMKTLRKRRRKSSDGRNKNEIKIMKN